MSNPREATVADVAAEAEVSVATASRVLGRSSHNVSEALRGRVFSAAEKLNYTPNSIGRMLKEGRSREIGIIVPTLTNPFYAQVVTGAEKECRKRGYNLIINCTHNQPKAEEDAIDSFMQKRVEGLLLSTINPDNSFLRGITERKKNIVLIDQMASGLDCDSISFDYYMGGAMAAGYLADHGHSRIAFLSPDLARGSRQRIFEGAEGEILRRYPSPQGRLEAVLLQGDGACLEAEEYVAGRELAKRFIELGCPASAIIAVNDMTAFGIIQELNIHSILVPEDISIIGFDNISFSAMSSPPLTTIEQPSYETGQAAVRVLLSRIKQTVDMNTGIVLKPSVIERKTVSSKRSGPDE